MKYLKIQEFVRRARKRARKQGCQRCKRPAQLGLRGSPKLSELARNGSGIEKIKKAIRERGWYCLKCVRRMDGTTAATTLRDQFPPGPEGRVAWQTHLMKTNPPSGYELDPDSPPDTPSLREIVK